ncbi:MAG: S53 family peptidase [Candidatus Sulfotelmatobacter sp.]
MRSWKLLVLLFAPILCFAAQADRISGPIDSNQKIALAGNIHPLAKPEYDQGPVEPTLQFSSVTVVMAPSPSQQAALDQLLAQQQDRTSPNYHKWLTPEQYADRFGLSQNDLNKVALWLQSEGLTVLRVARGRNAIVVSGTAAQIQSAFSTEIHRYNVRGEQHIANAVPVSIPSALSGIVTGVRGLTNFRLKPMYVRAAPAAHPRYTTTLQGSTNYFIAPGDLATLYDITPLYSAATPIDGTGQRLAIIGQTDVYAADLNDFRKGFGLSTFTTATTATTGDCTVNPSGIIETPCDTTNLDYILAGTDYGVSPFGDVIEADLDLEWSGAIARNAQIVFVNSPVSSDGTSGGVDVALQYAIDNTVAPVISMSYGLCESQTESLETELQQANTEGITVMNSAGDTGSFACDNVPPGTTSTSEPNPPFKGAEYGIAVNYPASSPEVTGVGGTSIPLADFTAAYWGSTNATDGGSALATLIGQEAAWNDDPVFAQVCHGDPTNQFCENGGPPAVTGWVPLTSTATAQQVQEDLWISSGGGGVSNCYTETAEGICQAGFPKPSWQTVMIPGLTSPQSTYRFVPDVSLLASPNFPGYIICTPMNALTGSGTDTSSSCASGIATAVDTNFSLVGGTSAASPIFAGIVTLMNQYLKSTGGLGNINPTLYNLAEVPADGALHHITSGENDVYCQANTPGGQPSDVTCPSADVAGFSASSSDATTGYNLVAGLGSVDADALAIAWNAYLDPDFALTAGALAPTSVPAGETASATLTISPIAGSAGMVVNFAPSGCTGLPVGTTCSFNPPSVNFDGTDPVTTAVTISTTVNMALPGGAQTITVVPTNSPGTKATVSLAVTKTNESFSLSSTAKTFAVGVGGTASIQITVSGTNGFISPGNSTTVVPLTYSCSGIPANAEISCQPQGNAQPTTATAVTVALVTTPVTAKLNRPFGRSRIFYAALLPGIFGLMFVRPRMRSLRMLGLIMVLGFSTVWLGSCSGSKTSNVGPNSLSNGGTPPGNYSITINATTGGPVPLTGSLPITLSVSAQ